MATFIGRRWLTDCDRGQADRVGAQAVVRPGFPEGSTRPALARDHDDQESPLMTDLTTQTMTEVLDLASLIAVQPQATVSRTALRADGARVVLFAFDVGQVLTEHTAAMPVLLQTLDGHLRIGAEGRTLDLVPGGIIHLDARLPHTVEALEPSRLMLTMLDARARPVNDSVCIGSD
ncbi:cupin domain-containing protein [Cellulomonas hominis]